MDVSFVGFTGNSQVISFIKTFTETPAFTKPMEDMYAEEGKTTVLECMASGSPKPKLEWLKDGEELEVSDRHFFTADNQLLIIVQTKPTDAGM